MRTLQILETDHGATVILPDDLAARLFLEGKSELDVQIEGRSIVIPIPQPSVGSAVATD